MPIPFINRELSWLEFNQRVLEQAKKEDVPLLERFKFLAITASNLDEFFQVRVGGLALLKSRGGRQRRDPSGLTPTQQLKAVRQRAMDFVTDQYHVLHDALFPALRQGGVVFPAMAELSPAQQDQLSAFFHSSVAPLLTPLAIDVVAPPQIPSLRLIVLASLRADDDRQSARRHVLVAVPDGLSRLVPVETHDDTRAFVWLEDLVAHHIGALFPGESSCSTAIFRMTRNSDIAVQEEDAINLAGEMEQMLAARKFSDAVRVELSAGMSAGLAKLVLQITGAKTEETYPCQGRLDLSGLMELVGLPGLEHLRDAEWPGFPSPDILPAEPIFDAIARQDILLHHPYESFDPVLRLIEEAANDRGVLAIKQVLYRTARNSRIVDALIRAAENGKHVVVLVELKARFDEARNIGRAEELQRAGVQIVYGVHGLKTHAKICLIVRREAGRLRRYVHLGTGNYNEVTARLYTDISLLTCRPEYGADASLFFNAVTGRSKLLQFQRLVPAPTEMKPRLLALIASEAERARQGQQAKILAKMNSLQDPDIIGALYEAADAGVEIKLNVRGICCLKPELGKKNRIIVVSIVDRFLEHARIFYFRQGGDPEIFISSADWMGRNLDRRIELMIPIEDPRLRRRLLGILETFFRDNTNASLILPDGTFRPLTPPQGKKAFRAQKKFHREARRIARAREREQAMRFEPHLPPQ